MKTPPPGWKYAFTTWMRIWDRALLELVARPYSLRATLVERTAYGRLCELTAERDRQRTETP